MDNYEALKIANALLDDFKRLVFPNWPQYKECWRYQEFLQMIEEIRGNAPITDHFYVDNFTGMGGEDAADEFEEIYRKLSYLKHMLASEKENREQNAKGFILYDAKTKQIVSTEQIRAIVINEDRMDNPERDRKIPVTPDRTRSPDGNPTLQ